jgi:outer membrane protein assembly factor BamB
MLAAVTDRLVMMEGVRDGATILSARDTATGEERWSQPESRADWGRKSNSRAVSTGAAHFCFLDRLDTIDNTTGELRWSRPVPPKSYGESMAVLGDLLCVVEFPDPKGAHLQALNAATGAERWRQPCDRASDLATDGRFIYQASDAGVVARRPDTGDVQWSAPFQRGSSVHSSIAAAANGPVVLGANTGVADLIAVLDGQSTWTFRGDAVKASDQLFGPLIVGRSAIVGAGTKIYSVALD